MANVDVRLPPDIIRAIERIISKGESAKVKYDRGVVKVHSMSLKLESTTEI